jgi:hypothetical protein
MIQIQNEIGNYSSKMPDLKLHLEKFWKQDKLNGETMNQLYQDL